MYLILGIQFGVIALLLSVHVRMRRKLTLANKAVQLLAEYDVWNHTEKRIDSVTAYLRGWDDCLETMTPYEEKV